MEAGLRAAALRYIYHTPELREKVVFYNGAQTEWHHGRQIPNYGKHVSKTLAWT